MVASAAFPVGVVVCAWVLRVSLQRENRRLREEDLGVGNLYVY